MRLKDEQYLKAVAQMKRTSDRLERLIKDLVLHPETRRTLEELGHDIGAMEDALLESGCTRMLVSTIEADLEWPE